MLRLGSLVAAAALAAPLSAVSAGSDASLAAPGAAPVAVATRPNVVLITTDDQSLDDLAFMPATRQLLAVQGASFDGISPHPLCCPARAEILTGQFAQNNGVLDNAGARGGYSALDTSSTLATWLHDAGYRTAFMGKFLNGYDASTIDDPAPGWNEWHPTIGRIYNYTDFTILGDGGQPQAYADDYQTDVYADLAVDTLRRFGAPRADGSAHAPFFLWTSFVAPHSTCSRATSLPCWMAPLPAERHSGMFLDQRPPAFSDPAYDEPDVSDKSSFVRSLSRFTDTQHRQILRSHRLRLQALQAVDEAVGRILRVLKNTGDLDNTVVIFTSDNGFLQGEHRIVGKNQPFEQALRVPFLMRGPGIPPGVTVPQIAATVDIAPTVAAVAGVRPGLTVDGRNLLPVVAGAGSWSTLLVQGSSKPAFGGPVDWYFRGVRTGRYTYVWYPSTGERELYDRRADPSQLQNVARNPRYRDVRVALKNRLDALKGCSGRTCRTSFGPLPPVRPAP